MIDLLLGGSPCQSLSITQSKTRQGLDGKSKLFFEYVRALEELKPKWWLFENVESMSDQTRDIMSDIFGCEPIMIDSNLVSAQDRKRYYWTNIPGVTQPDDKCIVLKDICIPRELIPGKYWYNGDFTHNGPDKKVQCTLHINGHDILKRVYNMNGKCGTLTMVSGGNQQKRCIKKVFFKKKECAES